MRFLLGTVGIITGIVLLVPFVYAIWERPMAFRRSAFEPILRIPLQQLADEGQFSKEVVLPSNEEIGAVDLDRRYIVAAASDRIVLCWKKLGIHVLVRTRDQLIKTGEAEGAPYAWSSQCPVSGVWFSAAAGEQVEISIRADPASALPQGEIIVMPFWQTEAKDRIVGSMIHASIVRISWFTTPIGLLLIGAGAFLIRRAKAL